MAEIKKPIVLAILDGWGFSAKTVGNPIKQARTPVLDRINAEYPMVLLQASGLAVGMAWGESGNSEVGHLNIGAGRIIEQYYSRINLAIADKSFFTNPALAGAFSHARQNGSRVHLIGLLTSGTVHAAFGHIAALIEMAVQNQQAETYLHLFTDGRDSGLQEGINILAKLNAEIAKHGCGKIATIVGRDFAMDRDNNWERTQKTYDLIVRAGGEKSNNLTATIGNYYQQGINDSALPPSVNEGAGYAGLADNDALIFFNFREDSMRQLSRAFTENEFPFFDRADLKNLYLAAMTRYLEAKAEDKYEVKAAFAPPEVKNGLAEILSLNGKSQMHMAESEKYAHVTYFFNGLKNAAFPGETDVFIDSIKDIEQNPALGSAEIAAKVGSALDQDLYDFIIFNLANADLLAHTGNFDAVVKGIEAVDAALGQIQSKALEKDGVLLVTADHGNAESLIYKTGGEAETKHDDSPVFFYLVGRQYQTPKTEHEIEEEAKSIDGILPDIAPTILQLLGLPQPPEMTGQSLLPSLGSESRG